jgi:hypothetical protein
MYDGQSHRKGLIAPSVVSRFQSNLTWNTSKRCWNSLLFLSCRYERSFTLLLLRQVNTDNNIAGNKMPFFAFVVLCHVWLWLMFSFHPTRTGRHVYRIHRVGTSVLQPATTPESYVCMSLLCQTTNVFERVIMEHKWDHFWDCHILKYVETITIPTIVDMVTFWSD